jgi:hypothetical protein
VRRVARDVEHQRQAQVAVGRQGRAQLVEPGRRAQERADGVRPGGQPVARVLVERDVHRRVARREQGGVVDQPAEQDRDVSHEV